MYVHPDFNGWDDDFTSSIWMNYDVAVLLLNTEEDDERETDNDYIRSICLPEKTEIIDERQLCHVTGKILYLSCVRSSKTPL